MVASVDTNRYIDIVGAGISGLLLGIIVASFMQATPGDPIDWWEVCAGSFFGFILGIFGTFWTWGYTIRLVPKLDFSPHIAYTLSSNGKYIYRFKMINIGRRVIMNAKVTASLARIKDDKTISHTKYIKLLKSNIDSIGHSRNLDKEAEGEFSPVRIITTSKRNNMDLSKIDVNQRIVFTVMAMDGESNMTKVFRTMYEKKDLKEGEFEKGKNLEVRSNC
jgi:hypothetical protein